MKRKRWVDDGPFPPHSIDVHRALRLISCHRPGWLSGTVVNEVGSVIRWTVADPRDSDDITPPSREVLTFLYEHGLLTAWRSEITELGVFMLDRWERGVLTTQSLPYQPARHATLVRICDAPPGWLLHVDDTEAGLPVFRERTMVAGTRLPTRELNALMRAGLLHLDDCGVTPLPGYGCAVLPTHAGTAHRAWWDKLYAHTTETEINNT